MGRQALSRGTDVLLSDPVSGVVARLGGHVRGAPGLAWAPAAGRLAKAGLDAAVRVWAAGCGRAVAVAGLDPGLVAAVVRLALSSSPSSSLLPSLPPLSLRLPLSSSSHSVPHF
jgi:hypothetical protein